MLKVYLKVTCEYLILLAECSRDDGEGIGDTVLRIHVRKLSYG
jgi:hypothetical protein